MEIFIIVYCTIDEHTLFTRETYAEIIQNFIKPLLTTIGFLGKKNKITSVTEKVMYRKAHNIQNK